MAGPPHAIRDDGTSSHLLQVLPENTDVGEMRPRSQTMPSRETRPPTLRLPEITVEDFSVNDTDIPEMHNLGQHDLNIPFRRRAYTCPDDLFRRKVTRPPTPPPFMSTGSPSKRRTKFVFPRKKLRQVPEANCEPPAGEEVSQVIEVTHSSGVTGYCDNSQVFHASGRGTFEEQPYAGLHKCPQRNANGNIVFQTLPTSADAGRSRRRVGREFIS